MKLVHILTVPMSFRLLQGQAAFLAARGVEVHAISSPGELADKFERSERVTVHRLPMTRTITPCADLFALVRLVRLLRHLRPDVVQCGTPKAGLLGTIAAWLVGVPVRIYHVRGLPLTTATGVRRIMLHATERIACAAATHVLSVSHSLRDVLDAEQICVRGDVDVLLDGSSNGVDAHGAFNPDQVATFRCSTRETLGIPPDAVVIGFVGRLVREKGVEELHRAWQGLRALNHQARLLLIGPFESEDALPGSIRDALKIDPRVHLTGLAWDTPALYAAMDVFCLPSHREGFPNVVLEASSMRLPVVVTRIPGCIDAVNDGLTGTLVPAGDAVALEQALSRYAADPALRTCHATAGREGVLRSFTQERIWAALLEYYRAAQAPTAVARPTRVLHVVTVPVTLEFMAGQTAFMGERGIELRFASSPGEGQAAFARREGTVVHSVQMSRRFTPLRDCLSVLRLLMVLVRERPAIVHAHTPKAGLVTMLAAWLVRVPVRIYHVHGLPYETATGLGRHIQKTCEAVSCALATRVLSVSSSVVRQLSGDGLCPPRKIGMLASGSIGGVDARHLFDPVPAAADSATLRAELGIDPAARLVGFVGRLTRDKGIDVLWRAWTRVRAAAPDAHLLLIGPHDTARACQTLSAELLEALRTDPRVHLVGGVPRTELPRYYAVMDVLCLPTYREGFPVTLLEAAAMALPSVASRVTGCVDAIIDGLTGTLVEPRDAGALSEALMRYLDDADMRKAHGAAARERVLRHFTPEQVWTAFAQEYRQLARPEVPASWYCRRGKRLLDLALVLVSAPAWVPVTIAIWLSVRSRIGAPAYFRQLRLGTNGGIFTLLKFRTMTEGRDADGGLLPDAERLSAFGRLLRASSLDELPELWNVLKGDMSLVGPRPLLVQYLDRYTPDQARRHAVRPGMTGWAQVNGRNAIDWEEKFALDVWYVDNCSLWLDIRILALTVSDVIARRGISQPGHATASEFMGSAR